MTFDDSDLTDPEDAYDVTDSVRERLRNFVRRLEYVIDRFDLDGEELRDRLARLREDLLTLRNETED